MHPILKTLLVLCVLLRPTVALHCDGRFMSLVDGECRCDAGYVGDAQMNICCPIVGAYDNDGASKIYAMVLTIDYAKFVDGDPNADMFECGFPTFPNKTDLFPPTQTIVGSDVQLRLQEIDAYTESVYPEQCPAGYFLHPSPYINVDGSLPDDWDALPDHEKYVLHCRKCEEGYFLAAGGFHWHCDACPETLTSFSSNPIQCFCAAGKEWSNVLNSCVECPLNTYKNEFGTPMRALPRQRRHGNCRTGELCL